MVTALVVVGLLVVATLYALVRLVVEFVGLADAPWPADPHGYGVVFGAVGVVVLSLVVLGQLAALVVLVMLLRRFRARDAAGDVVPGGDGEVRGGIPGPSRPEVLTPSRPPGPPAGRP